MSNPFENPMTRYALGLGSAAILALVAVVFFEGTFRWLLLGIAVVDGVTFPMMLQKAADGNRA